MMRTLVLYHPITCLTLCTTLALLFTPTLVHSHKTTTTLVTTACEPTPDPALCQAILRSDPRSTNAVNTQTLALIMIDFVKLGFSSSLQYVKDLSQKTRDPEIFRPLQDCVWVYHVVVDTSVNLAVRSVKQGVPKYGEKAMRDASIEAEVCLKSFPEGKVPERIIGWTPMLQEVSNVAAAMIKNLE